MACNNSRTQGSGTFTNLIFIKREYGDIMSFRDLDMNLQIYTASKPRTEKLKVSRRENSKIYNSIICILKLGRVHAQKFQKRKFTVQDIRHVNHPVTSVNTQHDFRFSSMHFMKETGT
jgi:hypothetical protein